MNSLVQIFLTISTCIVFFMAALSSFLYYQEKTKLSKAMLELWLTYVLYFLVSLITQGKSPEIVALSTFVWLWRLRAYRHIMEEIFLIPVNHRWHVRALVAGYVLGAIGFALGYRFEIYTAPICLSVTIVGIHQVASSYLKTRGQKFNVIYYVFLINVFLVYLNICTYPFLRLEAVYTIVGFSIALFTTFVTAVILPSIMFTEQTKAQAQRFQALVDERSQQLINQSKFSSLGEMAAGVAHEINNPLSVISGRAEQLKRLLMKGDVEEEKVLAGLDNIEKTAIRISRIVKGLKDFSRNADNSPMKPFRLRAIVDETLDLCRERFSHHGVEITVNEIPDIEVTGRNVQISQVLLNVLNNAFDAVADSKEKWIRMEITESEEKIILKISDSGPGIEPELRNKIMMPFFTTKEIGKGTGIGLSITRGIIEDHQGKFYLDTKSPTTCFVIELPKENLKNSLKAL